MDKKMINKYTVTPPELKPGDVLAVTVTCHIQAVNPDGSLVVRMYVCPYPYPYPGDNHNAPIPQGGAMNHNETVLRNLFPVVANRNDPEVLAYLFPQDKS